MYPHQSVASFHPTSKDSLCGAYGRKFRSMHLFHIYCKFKDWIHGDDPSHELIKIVQVYGKWMMKIKDSFYESLSFIWRTWDMAIFFSLFFLFFMPLWHFLSVDIFLIAYATFERILEREIITCGVLFCRWMKWNG
jgi:hypothetical protein